MTSQRGDGVVNPAQTPKRMTQKTFAHEDSLDPAAISKKSKVFCFFFSKKKCFLKIVNDTYPTLGFGNERHR
jgi:hypothetical protein